MIKRLACEPLILLIPLILLVGLLTHRNLCKGIKKINNLTPPRARARSMGPGARRDTHARPLGPYRRRPVGRPPAGSADRLCAFLVIALLTARTNALVPRTVRCTANTKDGTRCNVPASVGRTTCGLHHPANKQALVEGRARGRRNAGARRALLEQGLVVDGNRQQPEWYGLETHQDIVAARRAAARSLFASLRFREGDGGAANALTGILDALDPERATGEGAGGPVSIYVESQGGGWVRKTTAETTAPPTEPQTERSPWFPPTPEAAPVPPQDVHMGAPAEGLAALPLTESAGATATVIPIRGAGGTT